MAVLEYNSIYDKFDLECKLRKLEQEMIALKQEKLKLLDKLRALDADELEYLKRYHKEKYEKY